jgi:hypothetical protein
MIILSLRKGTSLESDRGVTTDARRRTGVCVCSLPADDQFSGRDAAYVRGLVF